MLDMLNIPKNSWTDACTACISPLKQVQGNAMLGIMHQSRHCCCLWQVAFVLFSQFLLKWLSLTAARFLHNSMLKQLLRCGIRWLVCVLRNPFAREWPVMHFSCLGPTYDCLLSGDT